MRMRMRIDGCVDDEVLGAVGTLEELLDVLADHRDMADLPAGTHRLPVQMDLQLRIGGECGVDPGGEIGGGPAEQIHHHRDRGDRGGRTQGEVGDSPQVLFELAGHRAVHGPVPGVVGAHGELVDADRAVRRLEQLDREHAHHVEVLGDREGESLDALLVC